MPSNTYMISPFEALFIASWMLKKSAPPSSLTKIILIEDSDITISDKGLINRMIIINRRILYILIPPIEYIKSIDFNFST